MTSNNSKLSIRVQGDIRERLSAFQAEHQLKSLSGAIGVILKNYFETIAEVPSAGEGAEDLPPVEPYDLPFSSAMTDILLKRIEKLETRLFAEEQQRNSLEIKLAVMEAELVKYHQTAKTARLQSGQATAVSTKANKALYEQSENESNNGVSPPQAKSKRTSKGGHSLPPPEAQSEKHQEIAETAPTPETASPVEKDSEATVAPPPKTMTTREIAQLLNWHRDKLEARKKRGNLPIQEGGYLIDCIGKKGGKLLWSVERLE
ncbi:MAG: hypothetical protein AB4352_27605 [Hormoscilla sp.]